MDVDNIETITVEYQDGVTHEYSGAGINKFKRDFLAAVSAQPPSLPTGSGVGSPSPSSIAPRFEKSIESSPYKKASLTYAPNTQSIQDAAKELQRGAEKSIGAKFK